MDKINFLNSSSFPLHSETLSMMQDQTLLTAKLALMGGNRYILSGCEEITEGGKTMISDGIIVIDGELYRIKKSEKKAYLTITSTPDNLNAFGKVYPEAYEIKTVQFSDTGDYQWEEISKIMTNAELYKRIQNITGDKPGTVKMWAGLVSAIPEEYRLCNGDEINKDEYPELYKVIGTSFGGNGTTNFKLPDLRGRFIVGFDSSENSEYNKIGAIGGAKEVELTTDHLPAHNHRNVGDGAFNKLSACSADVDLKNTPGSVDQNSPYDEYRVAGMTPGQWTQAEIKTVGKNKAHENRPPYYVLAYIIKAR